MTRLTRPAHSVKTLLSVFGIFLSLGLTAFGGPIAHLAYFRAAFVTKRHWLSEHAYHELVALCQILPGPASSQVGMAIGLARAGHLGAIAAWLGFTLPSAVALTLFALGLKHFHVTAQSGWLHGLNLVAVAVVAQAVWGMTKALKPAKKQWLIILGSTLVALSVPGAVTQIAIILAGGLLSYFFLRKPITLPYADFPIKTGKLSACLALSIFLSLLLLLPLLAEKPRLLYLSEGFFRAGALVFGGGHVILPLLQTVVTPMVPNTLFLAGYSATQALPGPLFAFAAYLGALAIPPPYSLFGAAFCLMAIFLPSYLLIIGVLPFWDK